jgi:hypothetical protein
MKLGNKTQTFLDDGMFGRIGTGFERCCHELIVDPILVRLT